MLCGFVLFCNFVVLVIRLCGCRLLVVCCWLIRLAGEFAFGCLNVVGLHFLIGLAINVTCRL